MWRWPVTVPAAEQRLCLTVTRRKYQLTRSRVQLQNRLEALLEEAHIKRSSLVSDLLRPNARRMLQAMADGATDPAVVAMRRDLDVGRLQVAVDDPFLVRGIARLSTGRASIA